MKKKSKIRLLTFQTQYFKLAPNLPQLKPKSNPKKRNMLTKINSRLLKTSITGTHAAAHGWLEFDMSQRQRSAFSWLWMARQVGIQQVFAMTLVRRLCVRVCVCVCEARLTHASVETWLCKAWLTNISRANEKTRNLQIC